MEIISILLLFAAVCVSKAENNTKSVVPVLSLDPKNKIHVNISNDDSNLQYLPFIMLLDQHSDSSEYWRETELLSLVRGNEAAVDYQRCANSPVQETVHFPSRRTVRPICRNSIDFQLCPQCAHFSNATECELFRDSCKERRVRPSEYHTYCENKYGKWRTMFVPADYSKCRCCDECIFYRELDQSCMHDEYDIDTEEFLPVTTIDFRAGCNPYWGHPDQETLALRCDKNLRRCVPMKILRLPDNKISITRRSYRFEPPAPECPESCRGYSCPAGAVPELQCAAGAFLPDRAHCNCCGRCSAYFRCGGTPSRSYRQSCRGYSCPAGAFLQDRAHCNCCGRCSAYTTKTFSELGEKCAEFKKTVHNVNGSEEIEVEEGFLEPGCDDALVCRQGICQDIHTVQSFSTLSRRKRAEDEPIAYEPCKREMKHFKKKYGEDGHLHFDAPQCTPLWLYAPVQCRRFVCYCALEDGTFIEGIKVPRVEVSNMNCDCAREKCRTGTNMECDGYGNYKNPLFRPHVELNDLDDVTKAREKTISPDDGEERK